MPSTITIEHIDFITIVPVIIAFLTGVAGPLVITYVKHLLRVRSKALRDLDRRRLDFVNSLETQDLINNSLNQLQVKYNLDRLWIAQFHNGGNFYPGNKSMKKMSVTFESTAPGVAADIMKMQNLPVSFFSTVLQKLNNGEESSVMDIFTLDDYALKSFWETKGVNTAYLFPIRCIEGGFIGVLGIDFVKKDGFLTDSIYNELKNEANILSGYIAALSVEKS
jgi:hypothetical protein